MQASSPAGLEFLTSRCSPSILQDPTRLSALSQKLPPKMWSMRWRPQDGALSTGARHPEKIVASLLSASPRGSEKTDTNLPHGKSSKSVGLGGEQTPTFPRLVISAHSTLRKCGA